MSVVTGSLNFFHFDFCCLWALRIENYPRSERYVTNIELREAAVCSLRNTLVNKLLVLFCSKHTWPRYEVAQVISLSCKYRRTATPSLLRNLLEWALRHFRLKINKQNLSILSLGLDLVLELELASVLELVVT